MSTRATIIVMDFQNQVRLYHHHDGYPEGVGTDLVRRLNRSGKYIDVEGFANKLIKDPNDEYELTMSFHGDEEYEYEVNMVARTVSCKHIRSGMIMEIPPPK